MVDARAATPVVGRLRTWGMSHVGHAFGSRALRSDGPPGGGPRVEIIFPFSKGLEMVLYFTFREEL